VATAISSILHPVTIDSTYATPARAPKKEKNAEKDVFFFLAW